MQVEDYSPNAVFNPCAREKPVMLHIMFPKVAAPMYSAPPVLPTKTIVDKSANSLRNAVIAIGDVRIANRLVITQYDAFPSSVSNSAMMLEQKQMKYRKEARFLFCVVDCIFDTGSR